MGLDSAPLPFPPLPPSAYRLRWTEFLRLRNFGAQPPEPQRTAEEDCLERYSAALLLFEAGGGVAVGSAVAVRLEGRPLLATAGHNLTGIRHPRQLWAVLRRDGDLLVPLRVRAFGGRVEQTEEGLIDVGWVEMETGSFGSAMGNLLSFLEPERLAAEPPRATSEPAAARYLVHGVPARLVQVRDGRLHRRLILTPLSLLTSMIEVSPTTPVDIALDYGSRALPPPPGLSGGGIWRVDPLRRSAPRLVGITRGWWPRSRQLRGTPIHHWVRLVEEELLEG